MESNSLVADSSALVTIVMKEPGYEAIQARLTEASSVLIGTPTVLETLMVLSRHVANPEALVQRLVAGVSATVVPFGEEHAELAFQCFVTYGKGRHPAGLNYGDCMAYAVAKVAKMPLLFVGNDFPQTDIAVA
jgi:ribonuclease VapC